MKSKLTLALLALVAVFSIGFTSCKKDTVVQADSGSYSFYVNIGPTQWQYDQSSNTYFFDVSAKNRLPVQFDYSIDGVLLYGGPSTSSGIGNYTYPINGNGTAINGDSYYFDAAVDQTIRIYVLPGNGSQRPSTYMYFNIIFIQPKNMGAISNVNKSDLNAVKQALHLSTNN